MWYDDLNGHIFHISGGDQQGEEGVTLAFEGAGTVFEDIYESPVTAIYNSTAFEIGGRYGGLREDMFEFALAFHIKSTDNLPWRIAESRFRKSLSFKEDGRIYCQIVGQSTRYLTVRLMETPKLKVQTDPNKQKYGLVLVKFVGAYPRWCEDDYTNTYVATTNTTTPAASAPTANTPSTSTSGGTLGAGTYRYKITALKNGGETTGSNEVSKITTGATSTVTVTWSAVSGATGYKVYQTPGVSGTELLLTTVGAVTTYTDTGALTPALPTVPTVNTTALEIGSLTVRNPSNNEIWVKYVAQAGNTGVVWTLPDYSYGDDRFDRAVADATRMIIMPPLNNGENIVVDSDEMSMAGQVVSSLDTAVYLRMNGIEFLYPIPAYTPPTVVPIAVSGAQAGNGIQIRCPITYSRPWGLEA